MRYFEDKEKLLLHYKLYRLTESNRSVENLKLNDFEECDNGRNVLNMLAHLSAQEVISISNVKVDNKYLELKKMIEKQKANGAINIGSVSSRRRVASEYLGITDELYKKVSRKKSINLKFLQNLYIKASRFIDEYITFALHVDRMAVKEYLDNYIVDFIKGEVVEQGAKNNYAYSIQVRAVKRTLGRLANVHGSRNIALSKWDIWTEDYNQNNAIYKEAQSQTNFIEVLLSMEKTKVIRIEHFFNDYSARVSILPRRNINYPDNHTRDFDRIATKLHEGTLWRERMEKQKKANKKTDKPVVEDMIVEFGGIKLDGTTGRCWKDGKFIKKFYTSKAPYNILRMLLLAKGEEVTYDDFKNGINGLPPYEKEMKAFIRRIIKGLRSSFGINMGKNPEDNIFEWTGNGFFLKIVPSKQ